MADYDPQNASPVAGAGNPCLVPWCGKVDAEKPMCFRGEDWCCENHRKLVEVQGGSS